MKLRTAAAALLLAFALLPAAAQALELKPAVGLTFSDVSKDPATGSAKAKAGWQAGGTVLLGEGLYFEGGLFYAKKSTDITAASASGAIDVSGITGLRIPAMVGFHLIGSPTDFLAVRAFGGGSMFIVTSVDAVGVTKSDFESPTYGVFAGVGVDVAFLFADLKYEWSLTDVSKLSTIDVGSSRSVYLNVGLKL